MQKWIWPRIGSTPISQNSDSDVFDRADYPYTETFVREAIQNTLDARLNLSLPAVISFRFHTASNANLRDVLHGAVDLRRKAELKLPPEWEDGKVEWLTIEDFNTKGLDGDLDDRLGNFWNYWLNFGLSNKTGQGRGGRGIGRVTFLIASRIQTVIGLTRRQIDGNTAACGMSVLRPMRIDGMLRSTHAYLAAKENETQSVFHLHEGDEFHELVRSGFGFTGYASGSGTSGLALAIPYPHKELNPDGILASTIEHFAPAILNGSLIVKVDDRTLDENTIDEVGVDVAGKIAAPSIREDVGRYISLLKVGFITEPKALDVDVRAGLSGIRDVEQAIRLRSEIEAGKTVVLRFAFDLTRRGATHRVALKAVAAKTPEERRPLDRLFREGMSLPDVKAANPGEIDLLIYVDDEVLATYLNFCEGKAHLDLLSSKEVVAKLEEQGYRPIRRVRDFVKSLPAEVRSFLTPEITEPEVDVFDSFFSVPDENEGKRKGLGGIPEKNPPPPPPPPLPRISAIKVRTLETGFRVEANPDFADWPVNVSVSMAYADGTRSPAWSEFDFTVDDLEMEMSGCECNFVKNKLTARNCGSSFNIEVTGFDTLRELDTGIRIWKNAQNN